MDTLVFLDRGTLRTTIRSPNFPHRWVEFDQTASDEVVDRLKTATMVMTNKVRITDEHLAKLPNLRFIVVTATGYDNIDLESCRRRSIGVANVPGYASGSVPEHVILLMLALRRNLLSMHWAVRAGRWALSPLPALLDYPVEDLAGTTLGLVGYGELAHGVETLARAFGMRVMVAERKNAETLRDGRSVFEDVLRQSDVVSVHAPLTPETKRLFGPAEFSLMKKTALFINTARGGLVDENALADALREGRLGGAGLDVLSEEPPRNGNAMLDPALPNVIVTPHVAWTSRQALARLAEDVIANLEAFSNGERRNRLV